MTIEQLASVLQQDASSGAPRKYRAHCTTNRCYRAASIAVTQAQRTRLIESQGLSPRPIDVESLATEAAELEQRESAGILIGIGLALLQAVLSWLIRRALDRLVEAEHGR